MLFLLCVILSGCGIIGTAVDKNLNSVANTESGAPFADFKKKHGDAFVADLHADTLLWPREMFPLKGPEANKGYDTGHVDYPRLINGGVDLQMLTVVTKYPLTTTSIEDNPIYDPDAINLVGLLSVAQMWPPATWFDLNERALYQAGRLRKSVNAANGQLVMIETAQELINFHKDNQKHPDGIAVMLGIEGAHALEIGIPPEGPIDETAKLIIHDRVDEMFDAGFRMISPTHHFDNEFGRSNTGLHGVPDDGIVDDGLTNLGHEAILYMMQKGILIDLAHASNNTISDVLKLAKKIRQRVVVSHTGVQGVCKTNRNLSDGQIVDIAKAGGVIGIIYWDKLQWCPTGGGEATAAQILDGIVRSMEYVMNSIADYKVGSDAIPGAPSQYVALGSDFDGAVRTPFDTAGVWRIRAALEESGMNLSASDIDNIMGGNVLRLLIETLP